jgi:hypothetical protein
MTKIPSIILIFLILIGCSDYETKTYISKTGNYSVKATVNRTNEKADDYADVLIHIYDKSKKELHKFNSGAGDFNKWSLGWTLLGDTIILQSSDIGNKAWIIKNGLEKETQITKELNEQIDKLGKDK